MKKKKRAGRRVIRVRYVGTAAVREIGALRWDSSNGYMCDVDDPEMLLNLMTYPRNQFELVDQISLEEVDAWINSNNLGSQNLEDQEADQTEKE